MEASNPSEEDQVVIHDFFPRFRVYKLGRVETRGSAKSKSSRPHKIRIKTSPSSPKTSSYISLETAVFVRIFDPVDVRTSSLKQRKLPLLVYAHGGAFCLQSAFSSTFHHYVSSLVSEANVIAVSIDYRLAPENPIPACYEDSWVVIQWGAAHHNRNGPEPLLNDHVDFSRVFLAGDSAGANIAHNMLVRIGSDLGTHLNPLKILGAALVLHPFFDNDELDTMWVCLCLSSAGIHDPRLNPAAGPTRMGRIWVDRMMICLAGNDHLKERGVSYYEALKKSGWSGEVQIVETEGEGHVFHLLNQDSEKALALLKRVASFLNGA